MTRDQKDLLIKDLCARLPYNVKLECKWKTPAPNGTYGMITTMDSFVLDQVCNIEDTDVPFNEFKPYLFPLSSMTEEQKNDCPINETNLNIMTSNIGYGIIEMPWRLLYLFVDWCNKNHFDYRGLIPMGLANDATELNIY